MTKIEILHDRLKVNFVLNHSKIFRIINSRLFNPLIIYKSARAHNMLNVENIK